MSEPVLSVRPAGRGVASPTASPGPAGGHPPARLRIATRPAGERTTVVAVGDIDMNTREDLRQALGTALSASGRGIDLDLSGVGFCDCSGLNVLLLVHRLAVAEGRTVAVRSASPAVERLLDLTGTAPLFASAHRVAPRAAEGADAERELRAEVVQLKRAMRTRPVIDLARGVLMATFGLSPEDAWSVLVTVSQNANIKLHHLAEGTVGTVRGEPLPRSLRRQLYAAVAQLSTDRTDRANGPDYADDADRPGREREP
ncbi:ANTAR domain-containing protein [Streptomyces apricus]|uniref:STAS domain-containing protein n=1 Tax=Streptomyces apricus TaxID=1828112 RepID=A0A5B0BL85_9ACTN|nr:ANTAR domain-containing protein [Streptomyces apricus]KAA0942211.1 STAS domain-containing protein [Streptomyces apricus]